jgi:hypothetical protein
MWEESEVTQTPTQTPEAKRRSLEDFKELVLDKTYFLEGNQILSGAFVGRLLAKEGYTGQFDKSYRVVIIDQEVKTVELIYTDFIELSGDRKYVLRLNDQVNLVEDTVPVPGSTPNTYARSSLRRSPIHPTKLLRRFSGESTDSFLLRNPESGLPPTSPPEFPTHGGEYFTNRDIDDEDETKSWDKVDKEN